MVVEALPTLIHVSVSLFFAGLTVFLWNVNLTILKVVLSWISVCTVVYGCITLIPIFRHDSPYYSPLTPLARPAVAVAVLTFALIYYSFYQLASCCSSYFSCSGPARLVGRPVEWFAHVMDMIRLTPEKAAPKSSPEIDARALMWTFNSLDEDRELERFFSGLPGFHSSKLLKEPLHHLKELQKLRLMEAVILLWDRSFSSNVFPDQVKLQRATICAKVIGLLVYPGAFQDISSQLVSEDLHEPMQSTEVVSFVRHWGHLAGEDMPLEQALFSIVVARVQRHDDAWFTLASNELYIPESILREYATHGHNLSFALLIYITRRQFTYIRNPAWLPFSISVVLRAASIIFNVQDTSPELQHEFCALWNQMVQEARNGTSKISEYALGPIRDVYLSLHQGTNSAPTRFSATTGDDDVNLWAPDAYPLCNVSGHTHNDSASPAFPRIVSHDDPALSPVSEAPVSPIAPSFPLPAPIRIDNSLTTVPPFNNSRPIRQTTESFRVPATSPDQATARAMRDTVTSGIMTPLPTPETSTSAPPLLTPATASVSVQHSSNTLAPSYPPNVPSSSSAPSHPALGHLGPSLCFTLFK